MDKREDSGQYYPGGKVIPVRPQPTPSGGASPYDGDPEMDGSAAPGTSQEYARGNHVHPTDTTRAPTNHTHTSDSWFTTALEAVKTWASGVFAAITHTHSRFDITGFAHALTHSSLGGDPLDPSSIGALPADGGTMTGNLVIHKSGGGSSVTVVDGTGSSARSMTMNVDGLVAGNGDHYYVPGGGGVLALVESIPDVIDPASATTAGSAADALATKTALEGKLDKSGGTVTGGVEFKVGDSVVLDTSVRYLVGDWYVRFGNLSLEAPTSDSHAVRLADLAAYLADNTANYSASATYAVGAFVKYNGALYVCKTAITTAEAWTPAHWTATPNVSSLFSSANTANDAANINYTATGETATTVKAKIQSIETLVGTANGDLEDALNGTEEE